MIYEFIIALISLCIGLTISFFLVKKIGFMAIPIGFVIGAVVLIIYTKYLM